MEDSSNKWNNRNREEEDSLRIRRNRLDSLQKSVRFIHYDPPSIAEDLAFGVDRKKDTFSGLISEISNGFSKSEMEKIGKCTKELEKMITADPRLCRFLTLDFLTLLVRLLECEQYSNIQTHVATIFTTIVTVDNVVVVHDILPIVSKLICSGVYMVRVEALWLLRNLVFKMANYEVEEAVAIVTPLIIKESISFNELHAASETLLVACEVHPYLSRERLKLVVPALMKLIESNVLMLLTSGCWGLAFLCDGREEMIVEDKYLGRLITRLVDVMNSIERTMILSSLHAMGSIVRWGSDDVIETIIKEDGALLILSVLLEEDDMYIVKQTCWILSNITARKEKHIRAVIDGVTDGDLIDLLVKVVLNCKLNDVRKEAVWTISNAMCGVGTDQIECFRDSCSKIVWADEISRTFSDRRLRVVMLQGLANIKLAKISWHGRPINGVELLSVLKDIMDDSESVICDASRRKSQVGYDKHEIPVFTNMTIHML